MATLCSSPSMTVPTPLSQARTVNTTSDAEPRLLRKEQHGVDVSGTTAVTTRTDAHWRSMPTAYRHREERNNSVRELSFSFEEDEENEENWDMTTTSLQDEETISTQNSRPSGNIPLHNGMSLWNPDEPRDDLMPPSLIMNEGTAKRSLKTASSPQQIRIRQRAQSESDATNLIRKTSWNPSSSYNRLRRRRSRAQTADETHWIAADETTTEVSESSWSSSSSSSSPSSSSSSSNEIVDTAREATSYQETRTTSIMEPVALETTHNSTHTASGSASTSRPSNHAANLNATAPSAQQSFRRNLNMNSTPNSVSENSSNNNSSVNNNNNSNSNNNDRNENDPERRARMRWIRINRRFQLVITFVALLFSLLLFAILICWVVLTSSYVISFDKSCDVPLKPYFWLVTLQLVLDVFRTDIMRIFFRYDAGSNQRIPCRVVVYNVAYLIYAVLVLRLGINAVFIGRSDCQETAPELYNASAAFISLSMAAWGTIVCGYLLPFCVVAALLTYNGYNPSSSPSNTAANGSVLPGGGSVPSQPVFPAAYSNMGAPPSCIELLPIIPTDYVLTVPSEYPKECCICMEDFRRSDVIVETACKHIFHKQCCREWLIQARSCPICRTDIPSHVTGVSEDSSNHGSATGGNTGTGTAQIPLGPTGRPVVGLLRMLNHTDSNLSSRTNSSNNNSAATASSPTSPSFALRSRSTTPQEGGGTAPVDLEEGFFSRIYPR